MNSCPLLPEEQDGDSDPGAGSGDHGEDVVRKSPRELPRVPRDPPSSFSTTPEPPFRAETEKEGHAEPPPPGVTATAEGRAWTPGDSHRCLVTGRDINAGRDRLSRGSGGAPPDGPGHTSGPGHTRDVGEGMSPPGRVSRLEDPLQGLPPAPRSVTSYGGPALDPGPPPNGPRLQDPRTPTRAAGLPLQLQHHALVQLFTITIYIYKENTAGDIGGTIIMIMEI